MIGVVCACLLGVVALGDAKRRREARSRRVLPSPRVAGRLPCARPDVPRLVLGEAPAVQTVADVERINARRAEHARQHATYKAVRFSTFGGHPLDAEAPTSEDRIVVSDLGVANVGRGMMATLEATAAELAATRRDLAPAAVAELAIDTSTTITMWPESAGHALRDYLATVAARTRTQIARARA